MPQIIVQDRSSNVQTVHTQPGVSLMQSITDAGIDDLMAICGGTCSCATCHVYIDSEQLIATLPPVSEDENLLLDMSGHRQENSRLSCQIRITDDLDGLAVSIAPED